MDGSPVRDAGDPVTLRRVGILAIVVASVTPAHAQGGTTFDTFTVTTRYQVCNDISLFARGSWCGVPSDTTFDREITGSPDGDFVNLVEGSGGNVALATKAKGTVTYTLAHTLAQPLPAIDLSFSYRLDRLEAEGVGFCGAIMSASSGCSYAQGWSTLSITPPTGGHLCTDGRDDSASYPFGDTSFDTRWIWAGPGSLDAGFYLTCHYADISAGTTLTLTFTTNTAVSPSGGAERAAVSGHFGPVILAG